MTAVSFDFLKNWGPSEWVNGVEIVLWSIIAMLALFPNFQHTFPYKAFNVPLAVAFAVFAFSDYLELHTGAWYRPWPLALLKALCIGAIAGFFIALLRRRNAPRASGNQSSSGAHADP